MKALVAGWFSFADGHATAGDLLARDVACNWLGQTGFAYDVAVAAPFSGGVDWRQLYPKDYSHVIFICGPFQRSGHEIEFLDRFSQCRLIGLDLSMLEPKSEWNPFDLLLERDSSECVRPDLALLSPPSRVPVVGLCLVEPYPGALVREANDAFDRLVKSREMAIVRIDTRLDADGKNSLRTPAEIEALIGKIDLLLTTRLHGLVLALKNGIPPIVIDPEPGGAKIRRQAELLGWPARFTVDRLDDRSLQDAFLQCLTDASRAKARKCGRHGKKLLQETYEAFSNEMRGGGAMEARYQARMAAADERGSLGGNMHLRSPSWGQRLSAGWSKVRKRLDIGGT